jgi:hypothetical protein
MPILTFSFDTGSVPLSRVVAGLATSFNYKPLLTDGSANPETEVQFAKRMVKQFIIAQVRNAEVQTAIMTAAGAANASVQEIPLT